jgi:hypothetical protein
VKLFLIRLATLIFFHQQIWAKCMYRFKADSSRIKQKSYGSSEKKTRQKEGHLRGTYIPNNTTMQEVEIIQKYLYSKKDNVLYVYH